METDSVLRLTNDKKLSMNYIHEKYLICAISFATVYKSFNMSKYVLIIACILLCSYKREKTTKDFFGNEHKLSGKTVDIDS
jgi:hypothetical protein